MDMLDLNKIKNLKYKSTIYSEHLILTDTHLIKIMNNEYIKYTFIEKNPTIKENFFKNKDLYIDNSFFKKVDNEDQIPYNHKKIEVLFYKYKINNKSKIYFIKEYLNKELIDYYFLSDENVDIVENSIITFLEELN